jgi:hypothetical protein
VAIASYSDLLTSIANWTARSDLTSTIPDFIALFESFVNRKLRVRQMESSTTLTTSDGDATLPTDYLAWRKVVWPGSTSLNLEYFDPVALSEQYPSSATGVPRAFTIEGTTLRARPIDDTTSITLVYYAKVPALTSTADTNWLLTAHPDFYLFGTLVEANAFLMDAEKGMLWKARRDEILEEIVRLNDKAKGPASMRLVGNYAP